MLKEIRQISSDNLRSLCIEKNWYTNGNGEEYARMFDLADGLANVTSNDIIEIATDIKEHSVTEYPISSICFEVARKCYSLFIEQ